MTGVCRRRLRLVTRGRRVGRERNRDRPQLRESFDRTSFCSTCGQPEERCRQRWVGDHEFVSVAVAAGRVAPVVAGRAAGLKQQMSCEEPRPVNPGRAHRPSPVVDRLRDELTESAAAAAESEMA